ncbi:MAG: MATE family efflux transporter [Gemmataceae bacterium]|nr:MATE family efflux transporter [Gemmataceae bacterium]
MDGMDDSDANIARPAVSTPAMTPAAAVSREQSLPLPSWRLVIALALPVLGQQGLSFLVYLSDRYLAGHIDNVADLAALQAAQTTAHYLSWAITCYTVLVTVGSTALVARFVGAGDREQAIDVTHQSILLAVILGAMGTLFALCGGIPLLTDIVQQHGAAAEYAEGFLRPLFFLLVFQIVEVAGIACLVGAGDTRTGLWVLGGVALVNIPLAWGFCRGLGGLPELGFVGIALGTALSHTLGCLAVVCVLARGRFGLALSWRRFKPRFDLMRRMLRVSIPAGFDSMSVVVGQFWFLGIVNVMGKVVGAAHGIALVWEGLGYLSGAAFGTAAMTLVGQNLGAGRPQEAARAGWRAFALAAIVMSIMGAIFFTFAHGMFRVFCPQPDQQPIIDAGVPALRLVAFTMPCLAATIVFTSALRGAGDTRVPVLFTWIGFFAVRIPLAYFLTTSAVNLGPLGVWPGLDLGLLGAWWAMFADLIIRGLFFLYRFAHGAWTKQKV